MQKRINSMIAVAIVFTVFCIAFNMMLTPVAKKLNMEREAVAVERVGV